MKKSLSLTLVLITIFVAFLPLHAQEPTAQQPAAQEPTAEDAAKQKAELEKNAYRLLDQVIDEIQSLRLPENRVRIQINTADLLWDRNQERARSLFQQASEGVSDFVRSAATASPGNQRGGQQPDRRAF